MKIEAPSNPVELQEELIINCKHLISDVFLLECMIQYGKEQFTASGIFSDEDRGLALRRVVDYIEQHSKDIMTISGSIMRCLCANYESDNEHTPAP